MWNPADFIMKSGGFHAKDLYITFISVLDLMNEKKKQHSVVDHEIQRIS